MRSRESRPLDRLVPRFARLAPRERNAPAPRCDLPSVVSTLCSGVAEVGPAKLVVDPGFLDHGPRVVAEVVARVQCPVTLAGNPPASGSRGFVLTHLAGPPVLARRVAREAGLWCRALNRPLLAVHLTATGEGHLPHEREGLGELVEPLAAWWSSSGSTWTCAIVRWRSSWPAQRWTTGRTSRSWGRSTRQTSLEHALAMLLGVGTGTIVVLPPPPAPRRRREGLLSALPWAIAFLGAGGAVLAHVLG